MSIAGIAAAAGQIAGGISALSGGNERDASYRIPTNTQAQQLAMNGNDNALLFLRQRTGAYGIQYVPSAGLPETPGNIGGWATEAARQDAKVKYEAVLASRQISATSGAAVNAAKSTFETATGTKVAALRPEQWALVGIGVLALGFILSRMVK